MDDAGCTAKQLQVLADLASRCDDAAAGYLVAAALVQDPTLRDELMQRVHNRDRFCAELSALLQRYGGSAVPAGTMMGAAHRGWMELKHAIDPEDVAVVTACATAESAVIERYEAARMSDFPADVQRVLERQLDAISRARRRLRHYEALHGLHEQDAQRSLEIQKAQTHRRRGGTVVA